MTVPVGAATLAIVRSIRRGLESGRTVRLKAMGSDSGNVASGTGGAHDQGTVTTCDTTTFKAARIGGDLTPPVIAVRPSTLKETIRTATPSWTGATTTLQSTSCRVIASMAWKSAHVYQILAEYGHTCRVQASATLQECSPYCREQTRSRQSAVTIAVTAVATKGTTHIRCSIFLQPTLRSCGGEQAARSRKRFA